MIDSYKQWLQQSLGQHYKVEIEEEIDYNNITKDTKNLVILNNFSGNNFKSAIVFTYQLIVFTKDVKQTMNELQMFSWMHNEEIIETNTFPFIRQQMAQPINNTNFMSVLDGYVGVITMTVTLLASVDLTDIKSVKIDDEEINPTQLIITYQTVNTSNRKNNEELNRTNIGEANLNLQITQPINTTNFYKKTRNIMFGKISKVTEFDIEIEFMDGFISKDKYKISSDSLSFDRSALTSTSITFVK